MSVTIGRYAPSPSGPLHLGSLLAALGSYLQARSGGGQWVLRIDDVDTPRVVAGADGIVLDTLAAFGFRWDGQPLYQSSRSEAYAWALRRLRTCGHAFDCGCIRREARSGAIGIEGPIYPGTCRGGLPPGREPRSLRLRVDDTPVTVVDRIQGRHAQRLARDIGDFVIRRADGIVAYQLATVVDDAFQGMTEIVRGADLLPSTPRQIFLQQCLGLATPSYAHLPVLVDGNGDKLGKSRGALALSSEQISRQLWRCLSLLGQQPPDSLCDAPIARLMRWAIDNWSLDRVPRVASIAVNGQCTATTVHRPSARGWPNGVN